jgi:hypothetical protein
LVYALLLRAVSSFQGGFPEFTPEDWKVFAEYGRTMLAVQEFEFFLMKVVDEEVEEFNSASATSREDLYRRLDKLFRLTAGQLKSKLERETRIPEALLQEVETVVGCRNELAHRFLVLYRTERRFWEIQRRLASDPEFCDPNLSDYQNEALRQQAIESGYKLPEAVSREALDELREQRERFEAAEELLHAWAHEGRCF